MKGKITGILVVLCFLLCCASPGARQAKIYQGQLETMIGKKTAEMESTFKDWKFSLMDTWQEDNPSMEFVEEHNRPVVKFSEAEMKEIFSEEGRYHVQYFQKKEATTDASIGTIDEGGRGYMMDTAMSADRYTLIRVVYKDGALVHYRVWGSVHQTSIIGPGVKRVRK